MDAPRGWYSRGYLPHIDAGQVPVFLTWRLNDSLPAELLENWRHEAASLEDGARKLLIYRKVEAYLDAGHGSCVLGDPVAARIVQSTLLHDHGVRYELTAWVVMPNHVHCLLTPNPGTTLETILRTVKSVSSTKIHKALGGAGRLWQPDYFDRTIRDEEHFQKTAEYIEWNPVKAKLTSDPKRWPFSSANPLAFARLSVEKPVE